MFISVTNSILLDPEYSWEFWTEACTVRMKALNASLSLDIKCTDKCKRKCIDEEEESEELSL